MTVRKNLKLTDYQYTGLLLEIATFLALENLGVEPIPLHNPHDNDYAKDQHLKVDLIFIYENLLFGVECKNFSSRSHVSYEFIEKEVESRFKNTGLPFAKKVLVFGVLSFRIIQSLPQEYDLIKLGYQVAAHNDMKGAIEDLTRLFKDYLLSIKTLLDKKKLNLGIYSYMGKDEQLEINKGILKGLDEKFKEKV